LSAWPLKVGARDTEDMYRGASAPVYLVGHGGHDGTGRLVDTPVKPL